MHKFLAVFAIEAAASFTAAAQTALVTADRMLDVRSGRYVDKPQIPVRGGRIAQGRRASTMSSGR